MLVLIVTATKYWLIKRADIVRLAALPACLVVDLPALLACLPCWPACLFGLTAFLT
jgi:hypothetical protein